MRTAGFVLASCLAVACTWDDDAPVATPAIAEVPDLSAVSVEACPRPAPTTDPGVEQVEPAGLFIAGAVVAAIPTVPVPLGLDSFPAVAEWPHAAAAIRVSDDMTLEHAPRFSAEEIAILALTPEAAGQMEMWSSRSSEVDIVSLFAIYTAPADASVPFDADVGIVTLVFGARRDGSLAVGASDADEACSLLWSLQDTVDCHNARRSVLSPSEFLDDLAHEGPTREVLGAGC